ncbi:hypothetical protein Acsp06_20930 [Actinomycetospora sp. NBRC 106375]|uniref:hypothetical protein n=1 Tax=Actinomycetospora sp. NBRC 106375 TaxID=3032207 RepID=UPI0024A20EC8|nr:hypothetical protein [Actinomycetospora sp. NBRC 106375]GLZ45908.1 hypothetical protein Acsp06_20930 [Actinomycetospora sp. NBRC 106375]
MTEDDGAAKVLLRGLYDAVSLAEVRFLVSLAEPDDVPYLEREPVALREASLRAIDLLVGRGLVELGDVVAVAAVPPESEDGRRTGPPPVRFEPWPLSNEEGLERIRREWWDPERDLDPGNVVWLQNTSTGDEVARAIEAARHG